MRKTGIGIWIFMVLSAGSLWAQRIQLPPVPTGPSPKASGLEVSSAVKHDVSQALRTIPPMVEPADAKHEQFKGKPQSRPKSTSPDGALQLASGSRVVTTAGLNLLGVGQGFVGPSGAFQVSVAPPDTNGAVGTTQFVQWVNASFAVFDKLTGAVVYGPAAGNTLWSGFGGGCETHNDGDITAQYDKAANRWVMAQPVFTSPFMFCIAVSTTSDATGSYFRYAFPMPNFPDYPKLGIWPSGFFASFNMFNGNTFLGARACAFDRASMLVGNPATGQCAQLNTLFDSLLPSDLDGGLQGPAGSPDFYLNLGANSLNLWQFHADFSNPANATFTGPTNIPVAPFSDACAGGACIPQSGTNQTLDSLGDRLMYRLAYRAFSDHQSIVAVHSVTAGNSVGLRWYELRFNGGNVPNLFQQGTYAPDSSYRWMGSIGIDSAGDIALGYSVSNSTMHPAIRYSGRIPTDTLGTLETENSIVEGGGSQTTNLNRWGDYSSINIDPVDDCTFWYTSEYLQANGTFNWSTRIASFKFPNCVPANQPPTAIAVSPSSGAGASQTFSFLYSDPNGAADINYAFAMINNIVSSAHGCMTGYINGSNQLFLQNDAGAGWIGPGTPGTPGTLQNSQCTVDLSHSSAASTEWNLTLNLALSFTPAFIGNQKIFMNVFDKGGLSNPPGWQQYGTWTVVASPDHPPQSVSVTPLSGTGSSQAFQFLYTDPDGFVDLNQIFVFINSTSGPGNGCVLVYLQASNGLFLLNDAATAWLGPASPGSAGTLQNSQCTVSLPASSISTSGSNLTLNLALSFTTAFLGPQNIIMNAVDYAGQTSGWQPRGSYTVTPAVDHAPQAVSVTPSTGTGFNQVFNFLYSDPDGFVDLNQVYALINGSLSATNGCTIGYLEASNQLLLINDAGTAWLGPATPGSAGTLQNSQCTVNVAGSSVSKSSTNLTVNLSLTFSPSFATGQSIFMYAADNSGQNSGWQNRGSWTP
jgi:hypothetical protein